MLKKEVNLVSERDSLKIEHISKFKEIFRAEIKFTFLKNIDKLFFSIRSICIKLSFDHRNIVKFYFSMLKSLMR
jgi:hypothetical protein